MFLPGIVLAVAATAHLSSDVEISPAVSAVIAKYERDFGLEAEQELEALRAGGDKTAAAALGELLMLPTRAGGPDFTRSCDYSEAAGRHASALHNLATCHFTGDGRPRNLTRARELYGQAVDLGFAKAACALGNMLIGGDGGPPEPDRGLDLCRRAADVGEPDAQTDYGGYLLTGQYLAKDAVAARRYLSLAAEEGHRNAAFLLGQIHWNGDGTNKDVAEAAKWWLVAYKGGRNDAARLLGRAALAPIIADLQAKRPIPIAGIEEAKHWFRIAAEKDPDPEQRRKAAEMMSNLEVLAVNAK
jgi:uncharacterized protein